MEENVVLDEALQGDVTLADIFEACESLLKAISVMPDGEVLSLAMNAFFPASAVAMAIGKEFKEKERANKRIRELNEECLSLQNKQAELYALLSLQSLKKNELTSSITPEQYVRLSVINTFGYNPVHQEKVVDWVLTGRFSEDERK